MKSKDMEAAIKKYEQLPDRMISIIDSNITEAMRNYEWRKKWGDLSENTKIDVEVYEYVLTHMLSELLDINENYIREALREMGERYSFGFLATTQKTRKEYMETLKLIIESEAIAC